MFTDGIQLFPFFVKVSWMNTAWQCTRSIIHYTCFVCSYVLGFGRITTNEPTSFANWRPLVVTRKVVHQAIVTIYVEAILVVSPVVWLTARPRQVRQVSARYARYKRALRHRVRAVDEYKVIWHVCKARFMWSQEVRFSCGIELLHQQFFAVAPTIFFMPLRNHETQSRFKMA